MEYELGKKLELLEAHMGYLAGKIKDLETKIDQIIELAEGEIDGNREEPEPPDRGDNIGSMVPSPAKRGRGRPRKNPEEPIITKPTTGDNAI